MSEDFAILILFILGFLCVLCVAGAFFKKRQRRKGEKEYQNEKNKLSHPSQPETPGIEKPPVVTALEKHCTDKGKPKFLFLDSGCVCMETKELKQLWDYCKDNSILLTFPEDGYAEIRLLSESDEYKQTADFILKNKETYDYYFITSGLKRLFSCTDSGLRAPLPQEKSCFVFCNAFRYAEFVKYVKARSKDTIYVYCQDHCFSGSLPESFCSLERLKNEEKLFCETAFCTLDKKNEALEKLHLAHHLNTAISNPEKIYIGEKAYELMKLESLKEAGGGNAQGGEGRLYYLDEEKKRLLKLYKFFPSEAKVDKLKLLIEIGRNHPDLARNVAFPIELAYDAENQCIGFTMQNFMEANCSNLKSLNLRHYYDFNTIASHEKSKIKRIFFNHFLIVKKLAILYLELEFAGIYQIDFACENIIVHDSDNNPTVFIVDIDCVQVDLYLSAAYRLELLHPDLEVSPNDTIQVKDILSQNLREPHHTEFQFFVTALQTILIVPAVIGDESWSQTNRYSLSDKEPSIDAVEHRWQSIFKEGTAHREVFSNELHHRACYTIGDLCLCCELV